MTLILPAAPELRLDADHRYWVGSDNLLGVNEVLTSLGFESDDYFTETHSTRGQVIHEVLAGLAQGRVLDWDLLHPDLHGWVRSGEVWLERAIAEGAQVLGVEVRRFHPVYRYAGTIDLHILWRGYEWVLDWKSGKASNVTRFKLGAYELLLGPTVSGLPRRKGALELAKDGGAVNLVSYNMPEHFHDGNRFLSYLNTARDLRVYGPKEKTNDAN